LVRRLSAEGSSSPGTKALHSAPKHTRQYEAEVSGLSPDTKYYYAIYDGPERLTPESPDYYFRTLPVPGTDREATIWVAGDGGTGGKIQSAVQQAIIDWNKRHNAELDMFLHVGDMAYTKGLDSEFQGRFFEKYEDTLRNTVCWAAMGNHEGITSKGMDGVGPYYDAYRCPTKAESGGVASGREAYYSFDYGKTHFVVLDSCAETMSKTGKLTPLGEEMMAWLKEDLEKAKCDWLITYFHHPPYTKGSHDSDKQADFESIVMREKYLPLLESAGVDLVLSGHSHIYERSMLINGAYHTPSKAEGVVLDDGDGDPKGDGAYKKSPNRAKNAGAIYVVTGNAGTRLSRKGTIPFMKKIILEHGSVMLNVKGNVLRGTMVNKEGAASDVFELHKVPNTPVPSPISNPKAAPAMPLVRSVPADGTAAEKSDSSKDQKRMPEKFTTLVPTGAKWHYHLGPLPEGWTQPGFNANGWQVGVGGFGYGDDDDATELDMEDHSTSLGIRMEFEIKPGTNLEKVGLGVRFDDGFIAHMNGKEVTRGNVVGSGKQAKAPGNHEASETRFEYYPLKHAAGNLRIGKNVLCIEGHNDEIDSSDFTLDPQVILEN
jgi:3',5'-cyclic AMP phosphodiesterase CpdA